MNGRAQRRNLPLMTPGNRPPDACDVLVAGAGPVGLFLALLLRTRGHAVRIVEARAVPSGASKALAIMPRTLEEFRIAGISAPFENAGLRVTAAAVMAREGVLARLPVEPEGSWFDYVAMIPQNVTERILRERLADVGGTIEFGTELVGLVDGPDGVAVRLRTAAGEKRCTARYVVGCDGADSAVRQLIGFGFEAGARWDLFAVFDVELVGQMPPAELAIFPHVAGPLGIFPLDEKRWRLVAKLRRSDVAEPTLDFANELIGQRGPWDLGATKLHWGALLNLDRRNAPGMHKGSIFLAGDAAHVHSPLGGQGLNLGLGDAFNLAWKLDYAIAGYGMRQLFPSYSAERDRVAKQALRAIALLSNTMGARNLLARGIRDYLTPRVTENRAFRRAFASQLTGLGIKYDRSPIVDGVGRHAPDESVRAPGRERRLYDVLAGRYVIVVPASAPAIVVAAFDNFAHHYGGALSSLVADEPGEPVVRLVRPDGYLALEAALSGDDPTPVLERASAVLGTHVRRLGPRVRA